MTYYQKRCGTDVEPFPGDILASRTEATYWMKGNCNILVIFFLNFIIFNVLPSGSQREENGSENSQLTAVTRLMHHI